ncbi:nuclease-related domain-containing protein [Streptomyces rectiviolaceus]|uniref:NERD domain-containing protein n=1 Tax=Streptomyces rectiviolaceus TaxID=332591 RepID=A0ABP6NN45_9ACTN
MTYGNSASRQAQAIRAHARRGVWRRVTAWAGVNAEARRADVQAGAWVQGGQGEAATVGLVAPLAASGWHIRHDVRPPWGRGNYDHVLISPDGRAVLVIDSKQWRRNWPTTLKGGRVHCGLEDRHDQVEKAVKHAGQVQELLRMPDVDVLPLLVVHGSLVVGGHLAVRVPGLPAPVYVLASDWLVSTLSAVPFDAAPWRAGEVAARVDQVLRPYR